MLSVYVQVGFSNVTLKGSDMKLVRERLKWRPYGYFSTYPSNETAHKHCFYFVFIHSFHFLLYFLINNIFRFLDRKPH